MNNIRNAAGHNLMNSASMERGGSGRKRSNPMQDLDAFADSLSDEAEIRLSRLETSTEGILRHLKTARRRRDRIQRIQNEWALIATVTDRLLFYFYACFTITMSLVVLLIRPTMKNLDQYVPDYIEQCNSSSQTLEDLWKYTTK